MMCGICLAGLIAGRLAGISGGVILVAALGLVAILWVVWVDPLSTPRRTSAFAHSAGGVLAGWGIATTLLRRGVPTWALDRPRGGDRPHHRLGARRVRSATACSTRPSSRTGSTPAWDIFFGCAGGVAGMVVARLLTPQRITR